MRSKKVKRDKNYVSKVAKVEPKVAKVEPKVAKVEPKVAKVEPKVTKVEPKVAKVEPKVAKVEPKVTKVEQIKPKPVKVEEIKPKIKPANVEEGKLTKSKPKTSPDLLNKHGYNITNRSVDRRNSLGKLVILYGVTDLIKKLDSISVQNPNLSSKYNDDKRWVKDNFKSKRSVKKS
jgi:hypothetical protein